jgi:ferrous iron transport protein B
MPLYFRKSTQKMASPKIAFVGNPNCGKSSLFNLLTGLNQKVGNFPGVTVDGKNAHYKSATGHSLELIDLPGAYSLYPISMDESILSRALIYTSDPNHPDAVIYVADIRFLDKQLMLLTQVLDLGLPVLICLTNTDLYPTPMADAWVRLLEEKTRCTVIPISNRTKQNIELVRAQVDSYAQNPIYGNKADSFYKLDQESISMLPILETNKSEKDNYVTYLKSHPSLNGDQKTPLFTVSESIQRQIQETLSRYRLIEEWNSRIQQANTDQTGSSKTRISFTKKIDAVLTHPWWGMFIFLAVVFLMFQMIFSFASFPMDAIDYTFALMADQLDQFLPEAWWSDLLIQGILPGLAGVLVFIPQIALLFMVLSLLEEVGYMARVVYLLDHILVKFGLNGRSVMGLISGGACAIPAIMSTRSISNPRERLMTSFVIPLIPCSARIPVYAALIGFIVPTQYYFGILNLQGLVFMGLYFIGIGMALITAWIIHKFSKHEEKSILAMPLPTYQWPQLTQVILVVLDKIKSFVIEAGKVIFMISIVLWFLASFSFPGEQERTRSEASAEALKLNMSADETDHYVAAQMLEHSFAGKIGKSIEPVIAPLGFDWKIGIALITSFAAREVFVGTMSTIYSLGPDSDVSTLRDKMALEKAPDGSKFYSPKRSLSLVLFYAFAMQCMSTLAVMKRETGKWKWALIQFFYMGALAYLSSLLVFQFL